MLHPTWPDERAATPAITRTTLPPVPASIAGARRLARAALGPAVPEPLGIDVALVVSELVTNAVRHGTPPIELALVVDVRPDAWAVRVEVGDGDGAIPASCTAGEDAEGGRGLLIVDAVAARRGWEPAPGGGKRAYAELELVTG